MTKCLLYTIFLLPMLTLGNVAAEEKRYGFDLLNWSVICTDYRGGTEPIDSLAIRQALELEGWQLKTREEVKTQCRELEFPVMP